MEVNFEEEVESRANMLIAQLQKQGNSKYIGGIKGITCRLPVIQYASIDALSRHSGMSKNKVIVQLLYVAIHLAVNGLDRTNSRAFKKREAEVWADLTKEGFGETGDAE